MNRAAWQWRRVPVADYDGHMGHPSVGQTRALNDIFAGFMANYPPRRGLAILGCATGNGFEHIPRNKMVRVVGIDVNLSYLSQLRQQYGERLPWMELHCRDVLHCDFPDASFDHIHAGLFFEYVDPAVILAKVRPWLAEGGVLSTVLQLPKTGDDEGRVSESPFAGVKPLAAVIRLIEPASFASLAAENGLKEVRSELIELPQGKSFHAAVYQKTGD